MNEKEGKKNDLMLMRKGGQGKLLTRLKLKRFIAAFIL